MAGWVGKKSKVRGLLCGKVIRSRTRNGILTYTIHSVVSGRNDTLRFSRQARAIFVDRIRQHHTGSDLDREESKPLSFTPSMRPRLTQYSVGYPTICRRNNYWRIIINPPAWK